MNEDFPDEWFPRIITVALFRGQSLTMFTSFAISTIPLSPQFCIVVGCLYKSYTLRSTPS